MSRSSKLARRMYADLVRGQTTVRMANPIQASQSQPPIFVAGIYRSGTTLMRFILDSHSRIACPPETAFLTYLGNMVNDQRSSSGFEAMGFDRELVTALSAEFAAQFYESYAASWGKARWADKSPSYVQNLPWLAELFPSAQFISLMRNPLDQIDSHTMGGTIMPDRLIPFDSGGDPRIAAARYWKALATVQLEFEAENPAKVFPVRYEILASKPEVVLRDVFDFLSELWEPAVMRFDEFEHDFGLQDDIIRSTSSFEISSGGFEKWPDDVLTRCIRIVEATADTAGWSVVTTPLADMPTGNSER